MPISRSSNPLRMAPFCRTGAEFARDTVRFFREEIPAGSAAASAKRQAIPGPCRFPARRRRAYGASM